MTLAPTAEKPATPFDRIGGRDAVARLVNAFYDHMETDPAYAALRAMHAADLAPMRGSLTDFLCAWMGGPRDWFDKRPGACIMSMHRALPEMNYATATQWVLAMQAAARDTIADDPDFVESMIAAFARMSKAMAAHAGEVDSH